MLRFFLQNFHAEALRLFSHLASPDICEAMYDLACYCETVIYVAFFFSMACLAKGAPMRDFFFRLLS
jgi:hypothetical protein